MKNYSSYYAIKGLLLHLGHLHTLQNISKSIASDTDYVSFWNKIIRRYDINSIYATKMNKSLYGWNILKDLQKIFRIDYLTQLREFTRKIKQTHLNEGEVMATEE